MSVITIYPNEALQYHDALSIALDHLKTDALILIDQLLEDEQYGGVIPTDGDMFRVETLDKSIHLIQKLIKQIESNSSMPLKQES